MFARRRWVIRASAARGRTSWALADQVLSSGTNFVLTVFAARLLGPDHFGVFALLSAAFIVASGVIRGLSGEPLMVLFSGVRFAEREAAARRATGAAVTFGVVVGVPVLLTAAAAPVPGRAALLVLGVAFPGLILQDALRYALITLGRPKAAFASDAIWALVEFPLIGLVAVSGPTLAPLVGAWCAGGVVAGVVVAAGTRVWPTFAVRGWIAEHGAMGLRFAADFVISQAGGQIAIFALGLFAGAAQAGTFRVSQAVFGPLVILFVGARVAVLPELIRLGDSAPGRFVPAVKRLAVVLATVPVVLGVIVFAVPASVGATFFGETWRSARTLVPAMTVNAASGGVETGAVTGIRAVADASGGLYARALIGTLTLAAAVIGAALAGAPGAAAALAVVAPLAAVGWWRQFRHSYANRPDESAPRRFPPAIAATTAAGDARAGARR